MVEPREGLGFEGGEHRRDLLGRRAARPGSSLIMASAAGPNRRRPAPAPALWGSAVAQPRAGPLFDLVSGSSVEAALA